MVTAKAPGTEVVAIIRFQNVLTGQAKVPAVHNKESVTPLSGDALSLSKKIVSLVSRALSQRTGDSCSLTVQYSPPNVPQGGSEALL